MTERTQTPNLVEDALERIADALEGMREILAPHGVMALPKLDEALLERIKAGDRRPLQPYVEETPETFEGDAVPVEQRNFESYSAACARMIMSEQTGRREKLAAAFLMEIDPDLKGVNPSEIELVQQVSKDGRGYRWFFRKRG